MMNSYFVERKTCPGCGSEDTHVLREAVYTEPPLSKYLEQLYGKVGPGVEFEYLEGARFVVAECRTCGLVYQKEVPDEFLMRKLYEEWLDPEIIKANVKRERGAKLGLMMAKETTNVCQYIGKNPGQLKFLDFGMGWGGWCFMARGFGCEVYGMELSDHSISHAKELGINVIGWGDLKDHQFDIINSEQVFEHLAYPLQILERLGQSLKKGGIIRVNVPPGWDIKRRLTAWDWEASLSQEHEDSLNDIAPLQHINCFNGKALLRMGEKAGLKVVDVPNVAVQRAPKGIMHRIKAVFLPYYKSLMPQRVAQREEYRLRRVSKVYFMKT